MLNNSKDYQIQNAIKKIRGNLPKPTEKEGIFVFPYEIRSGVLNKTEEGFRSSKEEPDSFGFFQKLISGTDSINTVWQNSTKLVKPVGENKYYYDFKVGDYYIGELEPDTYGFSTSIQEDEMNLKTIKAEQNVTLRFVYNNLHSMKKLFPELKQFKVEKIDMFKLYKIPELFGETWLFIDEVNFDTFKDSEYGCSVTFKSLDDALLSSGRNVEGFIHNAAPGEPYANPRIANNETKDGFQKTIVLDKNSIEKPVGVKNLQIEVFGASFVSSFLVIGRKINYSTEKRQFYFTTWKILLPCDFVPPMTEKIYKTSSPTKNFFVLNNCSVSFNRTVNQIEQWKKQTDLVSEIPFNGTLNCPTGWKDGKQENLTNDKDPYYDYFNPLWKPLEKLSNVMTFDTQECAYAVDNLNQNLEDSFIDILNKNTFANLQTLELPLSFKSTKPYKWSNIPIIGGLVAACVGDRTLKEYKLEKKTDKFCCFIDPNIATMGVNIMGDKESAMIPLSIFGNENVPKLLGVESANTSLCFELTDKLIDTPNEYDTSYLGGNIKEDGSYIFSNKAPLLFSDKMKAKKVEDSFCIDKVIVWAGTTSDIKLTCFDKDYNSVWTTTVQSNGKYTKSIRNWATEISLGCWNADYCEKQDEFTFPINPIYAIDYDYGKPRPEFYKISVNKEWEIHDEISLQENVYSDLKDRNWVCTVNHNKQPYAYKFSSEKRFYIPDEVYEELDVFPPESLEDFKSRFNYEATGNVSLKLDPRSEGSRIFSSYGFYFDWKNDSGKHEFGTKSNDIRVKLSNPEFRGFWSTGFITEEMHFYPKWDDSDKKIYFCYRGATSIIGYSLNTSSISTLYLTLFQSGAPAGTFYGGTLKSYYELENIVIKPKK